MKKQILKIITLLLFTSVAISSCSVAYHEHRRAGYDHHDDHRYNEVHRY